MEKININQNKYRSKRCLIYIIILLIPIIRGTIFTRVRDAADYAQIDIYGLIDILSVCLMGLILFLSQKRFLINLYHSQTKYFVYYYCFCLMSFLWCFDGKIIYTCYRSIEMLIMYLFIYKIMYELNSLSQSFLLLIRISTLYTICSIVNISTKGNFTIEAFHTNTYTVTALINILLCIGCIKYKLFTIRKIRFHFILGWLALILGTSTASYFSLTTGLILYYSLKKNHIQYFKLLVIISTLYILYTLFSEMLISLFFPNKTKEAIENGTGRFDLWQKTIEVWLLKPIVGFGFPSGEKNLNFFGFSNQVATTHNIFLSILLNTGILGMIIFFRFLYDIYRKILLYMHKKVYLASILFIVLSAVLLNANSYPIIGSYWFASSTSVLGLIALAGIYLNNNLKNEKQKTK